MCYTRYPIHNPIIVECLNVSKACKCTSSDKYISIRLRFIYNFLYFCASKVENGALIKHIKNFTTWYIPMFNYRLRWVFHILLHFSLSIRTLFKYHDQTFNHFIRNQYLSHIKNLDKFYFCQTKSWKIFKQIFIL